MATRQRRAAVGLDFGTSAARAVVVDVADGTELSEGHAAYARGVITSLDASPLPVGWALQDPDDWLAAMTAASADAARQVDDDVLIVGLGVDFTSCTALLVDTVGTPICREDRHRADPHAWPKLWKHHGAERQAAALTERAATAAMPWLARFGGRLSSEWLIPKLLEIDDDAPHLLAEAACFIEAVDWITWQLTGTRARNACAAGYKALWDADGGWPGRELEELRPGVHDLVSRFVADTVVIPGTHVGDLRDGWASRMGLPAGIPVAAGMIDAHAGALGAGLVDSAAVYLAVGTSTCHMLLDDAERFVPGVAGVVRDGMLPGWFGYEAGQAAVGDMLAWYVEHVGRSHEELSAAAAASYPARHGLTALDWWNGCRTPYADDALTGVLAGLRLSTRPEEVYLALVEAGAFGARAVLDAFLEAGMRRDRVLVGGGLTANRLLLTVYAAVLGPLDVCTSQHVSARGAAMLGSVAGEAHPSLVDAAEAMKVTTSPVTADCAASAAYEGAYRRYVELSRAMTALAAQAPPAVP